jgi:Protein of unknown function (DUF2852)
MTAIANVELKLDQWGMGAWIALMVLGFILWWPVGLAILAYVLWSGRMGCWKRGEAGRRHDAAPDLGRWGRPTSGNHAFDEYRADTLRRLEDEQREFKEFLERLRFAKDKDEFDQFMADRKNRGGASPSPQPPQP